MATISRTGTLNCHTIRNLLNENGGSVVDSDVASAFDSRAKINPFARWKPVRYREMFRQDVSSSLPNYVPMWWVANNNRCGIEVPVYSSTSSLSGVTNPKSLWGHQYPRGGETEVYNPQDFRGYDTNANIMDSVNRYPGNDDLVMGVTVSMNLVGVRFGKHSATSSSLDYSDIWYITATSLNTMYLGLIAISTDGKYHGLTALPYTMIGLNNVYEDVYYSYDDHYACVPIDGAMFMMAREYRLYPVLFYNEQPKTKSSEGAISCGDYIPLPVAPITVNVVTASTIFTLSNLSASAGSNGTTVSFTVNNSGSSLLTGGSGTNASTSYFEIVYFKYSGYPSDYPDKTYTTYKVPDSITLNNGTNNLNILISELSPSSGQLIDLQVRFYYRGVLGNTIGNSFTDPF